MYSRKIQQGRNFSSVNSQRGRNRFGLTETRRDPLNANLFCLVFFFKDSKKSKSNVLTGGRLCGDCRKTRVHCNDALISIPGIERPIKMINLRSGAARASGMRGEC